MSARYYGPYQIIQHIGKVAYKLQLPEHSKLHPVFHISQLKRKHGDAPVHLLDLPTILPLQDKIPEFLLGRRMVKRNNQAATQLLIQWKDQSPEEATWEDYHTFTQIYPAFDLEDKVFFMEGRNCYGTKLNNTEPKRLNRPKDSQPESV